MAQAKLGGVSDLDWLFSESGPLAATIRDFRARPFQLEMARAVADTIALNKALVAEAGTGTGKTFAYLVPALMSGGKVIISTGTKTLQDQLFDRDIPTVRAALKVPVTVALLKARELCLPPSPGARAARRPVPHTGRRRRSRANRGVCAHQPDR